MNETVADRTAELVGALSLATDLGAGLAPESGMRTAVFAARIGLLVGLSPQQRRDAYYAGLLRFLGCTGFAHEEALLNGGDDRAFIRSFADVDLGSPAAVASRSFAKLAPAGGFLGRASAVIRFLGDPSGAEKVSSAHCAAAVFLSRRLGMSRGVARALDQMYERWDGRGVPLRLARTAVDKVARVLHAAHVAEVFHRIGGVAGALRELQRRSGAHFDPEIVDAVRGAGAAMFAGLDAATVWEPFLASEPQPPLKLRAADIDDVASAFAVYADIKSPYMLGHSTAVAELASSAAMAAGLPKAEQHLLHRAALLHDIGRVAVANGIWDKPGPLNAAERERVESSSAETERILRRSSALRPLAEVACAAYERLDGSGFHRRLKGGSLPFLSRLLAAADAYVAMTEPRSYRPAMTAADASRTLLDEVRAGRFDGDAVHAVLKAAGHPATRKAAPAGLSEREAQVLLILARGLTTKEIARSLGLSPRTVQTHIRHIFEKTGVRSRAAAALFAVETGLVGGPPSGG